MRTASRSQLSVALEEVELGDSRKPHRLIVGIVMRSGG